MNALGFMSPSNAEADARFRPVQRSAMQRRLAEHGAEFEERDGWLVATRIPGEESHALGIRDVTHLYAVHEGEGKPKAVDGALVHSVASRHTFAAVPAEKAGAAPKGFLDMTAAYAALEIAGPGAEVVMRRVTAHDLQDLPNVAPVSHVRSFIFRTGVESFVLFFNQEYGHYLWEVAVDAAEPLGGGARV